MYEITVDAAKGQGRNNDEKNIKASFSGGKVAKKSDDDPEIESDIPGVANIAPVRGKGSKQAAYF